MGDELEQNQYVLRLLKNIGISAPEYVIFIPWINHDPDQLYPWLTLPAVNSTGYGNESIIVDSDLKADFVGTYVIDADRKTTTTGLRFYNLLSEYNLTRNYVGTSFDLFVLYDCLLLYALAANKSYSQQLSSTTFNPSNIIQQFAGLEFEGASGFVEMDSTHDRIPYYGVYLITETEDFDLQQISTVNPQKFECNSTGECYKLNITSFDEQVFSDITNRTTEPACGFTGERCDYSKWYIIAGGISLIIFIILLCVYFRKQG